MTLNLAKIIDKKRSNDCNVFFSFLGIYTVSRGISQFTVNIAGERKRGLQLRGDILIKCYHRGLGNDRETIFACQFHTCAVADHILCFTRQELDYASNGKSVTIIVTALLN